MTLRHMILCKKNENLCIYVLSYDFMLKKYVMKFFHVILCKKKYVMTFFHVILCKKKYIMTFFHVILCKKNM